MRPELVEAVERLEARVRAAVDRRRAVDPEPGDGFLGLHLSDARVDALLTRPTGDIAFGSSWLVAPAPDGRLAALAKRAGLDPLDVALLLVAMAPDVDRRFEWLYGYLHDDVTRRRVSIGLALELCDQLPYDAEIRTRFDEGAALLRNGLVEVVDPDRSFLTRGLQVPDRVTDHLLGGAASSPGPGGTRFVPATPSETPVTIPAAGAAPLVYLHASGGAGIQEVLGALGKQGRDALVCDLRTVSTDADRGPLVSALMLESLLRDATVVLGPVSAEIAPQLRPLVSTRRPVVITGAGTWDPAWSEEVPFVIELDLARPGGSREVWRSRLGAGADELDLTKDVAAFRLDAERTDRAATAALVAASAEGGRVTSGHVRAGARAQNAARLEELARRTEPAVGWEELVLPEALLDQLREVVARARLSSVVLDGWGMRRGGGRGEGVAVLFAGDSGTGKTMSAEVLAGELGQDLYRIDLSTVVDKYIGETEKNLERIFTEAEHSNGVLFFDEADALFGKRTEVSDAHDRHANVEVAYLLQRMEDFSGVAILATNLRANLDDAFTRRLTAMIDFPMPDEPARRRLWDQCLGPRVPRADDADLDFCARQFELSGGSIRNITLAAAFLAADRGGSVGMTELMHATRQEYQKMGRLVTDQEFAGWT